jgi:E1A/CREB-binding protein
MIVAFQKVDGSEVAFLAFIVQEYYEDTSPPNRGCIYLAYLDTNYLFQPSDLRTEMYQTIVLGYFGHVKQLGFEFVHIWICPPNQDVGGGDYIFYCHPPEMRMPEQQRLESWYKQLFEVGMNQRIVLDFYVRRHGKDSLLLFVFQLLLFF